MEKLMLTPIASGYAATPGNEVASVTLDGGASRSRRIQLGAHSIVNVSWVTGEDGYRYLTAFFNTITGKGALPFLMDLLLDNPSLTTHICKFVPNTFKPISSVTARRFTASAQLEVKPLAINTASDLELVRSYNLALGQIGEFSFERISRIANVVLPAEVPA
jgi:hypothetical protein